MVNWIDHGEILNSGQVEWGAVLCGRPIVPIKTVPTIFISRIPAKPTGTIHNGQWYAFYHNSALSNHDWLRSICVDSLIYDENGGIKRINQTREPGTPFGGEPHEIPGTTQVEKMIFIK